MMMKSSAVAVSSKVFLGLPDHMPPIENIMNQYVPVQNSKFQIQKLNLKLKIQIQN